MIVCGNVFRTGSAATNISAHETKVRSLDFPCYSALNLAVNAAGFVSPCCAGLDQSLLNFGNINASPLHEILDIMNRSQIARILAFFGASFSCLS